MRGGVRMELLKVTKEVYEYYCHSVKGNENTPLNIVQAKLTRNMLMAYNVPQTAENIAKGRQMYHYGNLQFLVANNRVVWIKNSRKSCKWFYKDEKGYKILNDLLGITTYEKSLLLPWWKKLFRRVS